MDAPALLSEIRDADWQPKLGEVGAVVEGVADIDQSIRTILTTPKGSLPFQPDFGSDLWRYLDWPMAQARPHIVRHAVEAIAMWEPRVEVTEVSFDVDPDYPARALLRIGRRLRGAEGDLPTLALEVIA
jgi:uncharacterized protein